MPGPTGPATRAHRRTRALPRAACNADPPQNPTFPIRVLKLWSEGRRLLSLTFLSSRGPIEDGRNRYQPSRLRSSFRLMQKGVAVDLLDEEIRHVGARDEPACPAARIDQRAIGVRLRPIGQDHGTHDHPVELAPADDAFLHVLVVIDAPQQQMKRRAIKKPAAAAAVARPEASSRRSTA
jgi:hypothetical protein